MSMHLHHPSLSLNGRKKGRVKFRNANEARKARELDASWKELQKKWEVDAEDKRRKRAMKAEPLVYRLTSVTDRAGTAHIPSRDTGHSGVVSSKANPQYTGTEIIGVTVLHKSCLQPVFNRQEAIDAASMRR
ncbi:hypothetical protein [Haliscomenobacter sp.]|uniref:hypothetical protein n=1 Tax=Haliscomenobacter sp. TaxID=2717303 RepID=UPI003364D31F